MNNINGIPIRSTDQIIKPVFDYFNLEIGNELIIDKMIDYLDKLTKNSDFEIKRRYLWIDKEINVSSFYWAIIWGHSNPDVFHLQGKIEKGVVYDDESIYSKWLSAQG